MLRVCLDTFFFNNSIIQTNNQTLIPSTNTSTITTKYLKNIYIILMFVCFPFLISNAQKETVDLGSCSNGKFTQYFYLEGSISSEGCLFNKNPVGEWRSFYETGELKSLGVRNGEILKGKWIFYYLNSEISKVINYKKGEKEGEEITYSEEGILLIKSNWKLNKKEGEELRFYESGELKYRIFYIDNLKDGKSIRYSKTGRIIGFTTHKKGIIYSSESFNRYDINKKKTGIWKEFYENLKLLEEGPFIDGLRHGIFRYYDKRGNIEEILNFRFGIKIETEDNFNTVDVIRSYHDNGRVSQEIIYVNGLKNGVNRTFDDDGEIIGGGEYRKGILVGTGITNKSGDKEGDWIILYNDEEKKAEGEFVKGLKQGRWIYYFITGEIEQIGFYNKGEMDGEWNWWAASGEKLRTENYFHGFEEGSFIEKNIMGEILLEGVYKHGLKEGFWTYHVNDHREEGNFISGEFEGIWKHWYSNNQLKFEGKYSFGQPEGKHKYYFSSGLINYYGSYESGVKHGKWHHFNDEGIIEHMYKYKFGQLIKVDGRRVSKTNKYSRP